MIGDIAITRGDHVAFIDMIVHSNSCEELLYIRLNGMATPLYFTVDTPFFRYSISTVVHYPVAEFIGSVLGVGE